MNPVTGVWVDEMVSSTADDDDSLIHLWCCDSNLAMCGHDLTGSTFTVEGQEYDESEYCVVCDDLIDSPCPICGETL